ncbi:MAG TPA: 2-C-methyl-D-erythritol 4-phosphate cytidylyltransferase, partial [Bacteroidota bacterium]|nr:2-C-methyl-D-erythritol 4-phosphate cytidylyltransferase [Bacteroidota bacterium]
MMNGKRIGVALPAAGKGKRMGSDIPKQFLELDGRSILVHTLERLSAVTEIDLIVVAAAADDLHAVRQSADSYHLSKVKAIVRGGDRRQDSVWNCLEELSRLSIDIVVVHDAVRSFVKRETVLDVCLAAMEAGAAIPIVQPKDTIKLIDASGFIRSTLDRNTLGIVQTPQAFQFALLYDAYQKAMQEKFYGTDDASLVERYGGRVKAVEGDYF